MLSLQLISEAAERIQGVLRKTPVDECPILSDLLGVPVWLKLENEQITGSFKARGALFALLRAKDRGIGQVATCSAGNHGKGMAWAARMLGMKVTIFIPNSVDPTKLEGMIRMGAEVRTSEFSGYDETEKWAIAQANRIGLPFVSAFDDELVMAANGGTVAAEVLDQIPDVETLILPVGGGGLSGGASFYIKAMRPSCQVVLCQHEESPALKKSMDQGRAVVEMPAIETVAGGLEGGIGRLTFDVLKTRFDSLELVSEPEIKQAMAWFIRHHQMIIEGSAAVVIAACLREGFRKPKGPTVLVLSGRNVAAATIAQIMHRHPF